MFSMLVEALSGCQDVVQTAAEGDTVVARLRCSGTHLGVWRGHAPPGRRFECVG
ncbi:ester cyclase [Pseudarthrobacter sp. BIM B-2242]|uniref:ester cyclase n=1 Tax=Pseudarthrobacter sp. BIM B-2242 TaxID=2772401 RepID=UPI00351C98B0